MFGEEHVMAYAEADDDVERGVRPVEKLRLEDGVASGFEFLRVSNLVIGRHTQVGLIRRSAAADRGEDLEPAFFQDGGRPGCFIDQARAEGDADLLGADFFGELSISAA
jgi:hypothetical protein